MTKKIISLLIAVFAFASISSSLQAAGLTSTGKMTELNVGSSSIRVEMDITTNPDGCTDSASGLYVIRYSTNSKYEELYSSLLAARIADRDIKLYLDGCELDGAKMLATIKTVII